jgi:hypothetical protein
MLTICSASTAWLVTGCTMVCGKQAVYALLSMEEPAKLQQAYGIRPAVTESKL